MSRWRSGDYRGEKAELHILTSSLISLGLRLSRSEASLLGAVDLHDDAILDDQRHGTEFQATKRIAHVNQFVFKRRVVSRRLL